MPPQPLFFITGIRAIGEQLAKYKTGDWVKEFPAAVTVCDADGTIIEMNDKSARTFERDGGAALLGKNVLDCHPGPARRTLEGLLAGKKTNAYTIEKKGVRKLIFQCPWYREGKFCGLVELSVEIPDKPPHFRRT